jgi:hypothetical protein
VLQAGRPRGSISGQVIEYFPFPESFQLHYGPKVHSASKRDEFQEYSLGVKRGRRIRLVAASWLSRKCGILDSHNLTGLHGLLQEQLYFVTLPNSGT